jgi:hypothetical protein
MELVLQKQSNQLAQTGSRPIGSYGGGGGGSGAAGGMGNLAGELISSLQDLTSGIRKLVTAVQFNTKAIMSGPASMVSDSGQGKGLEDTVEGNRARDAQTGLLAKIEENTRGGGKKDSKKDEKKKSDWSFLDYIKGFGFAIAAALGTIVGLFTAQIKTMKFFGKLLMEGAEGIGAVLKRFAKFLGLDEVGANIQKKFQKIVTFVEDVVSGMRERIGKIGSTIANFFEESITKFKKYFSFLEESEIGKKLKSIGTFISDTVSRFVEPFKDAFKALGEEGTIMKFVTKIKDFFGGIGEYLGKFSKVFGVVSKLVAKIAYPIQIIMGIFDTVTGAIEGFKKEGVLGAIQGGITGLINGVFLSFFDLVKDGISWILDKIGFKDAAKFLDSFTFSDLFSDLMDKIFHPIRTLQEAFDKLDLKALVFEPMAKAWTWLNESLGGIPQKIVDNIKLYILDPLSNAFAPVVDMFKNMADKVIGFFSSFKIPGVEVDIPYVGKFGIGPWYPFKSSEKTQQAAAAPAAPQGTSAGTPEAANKTRAEFAANDPRLVSKQPEDASKVTNASKENADAAMARNGNGGANNTVIAPSVSNVSHKTELIRPSIRNQESSVSQWLRKGLSF